jgi:hypothetical protein
VSHCGEGQQHFDFLIKCGINWRNNLGVLQGKEFKPGVRHGEHLVETWNLGSILTFA